MGQKFKTFPSFIFNFRIHENKVKWNASAPHGILSITTVGNDNHDILNKYQSISSVNIADAFVTCTKDCDIHNSKEFYSMLYRSFTGTICNTVFDQAQTLPTYEDDITLLTIFTLFTTVASLQLSILSFNQITSLIL